MSDLLNIYETRYGSTEKVAEETENTEVEIFRKYAELAEGALSEEYGDDFTADDVEKLATKMIDHDLEQEYMEEKVAEFVQAGQIMAKAFKDELQK